MRRATSSSSIVAAAEGAKAGVAINKALQARAGLAVHVTADRADDDTAHEHRAIGRRLPTTTTTPAFDLDRPQSSR